jgi:hypothetical protein
MNNFAKIAFILFMIAACSAQNQDKRKYDFEIIDSLPFKKSFISSNWTERELYEINYIGEKKDTIIINHSPYPYPPPPPGVLYDTIGFQRIKEADLFSTMIENYIFKVDETSNIGSIYFDSVDIYIDTTQIIGKTNYPAYPVIIENKYFDKLSVCYAYDRSIGAILEAKDSIGNWQPINEEAYGRGLPIDEKIVLLKNHIIITSVYAHFGDYNTELRLRIGKNYSNIVSGTINYNQFHSRLHDE